MTEEEIILAPIETHLIAGVDEVGRGPLVGSVVAAAVILDPDKPIEGLADSKKLSAKKRALLEIEIKEKALSFAVAEASPAEIDDINILQASFLAMKRALELLPVKAEHVLVDGNKVLDISTPCQAIVKGDSKIKAIAAASILAKEYRDRQMVELAKLYPDYQFEKHKGYPTKLHMEKLEQFGAIDQHRKSFKPVMRALLAHKN
ncbi:ribonuclease HII [Catenovulum sp. SM1970]|uniref:ribonuclease HII n=1 Tax=Marinifaba aquimaris TaxID=2741323 RepID=UPI00157465D3|nr:ribonuclease HII [Marinifaba aquimaris]NTS77079.1 ribonuclease HII [Marinifaba aquimaris]